MANRYQTLSFSILALLAQAGNLSADLLAGWISSDTTGSISAQETAPGITGAVMDRGPGLVYNSSFDEIYDSSSWSLASAFPGSGDDNYLSFAIDLDTDIEATFTSLSLNSFPDNDGPDTLELRSSADNFATSLAVVTDLQLVNSTTVFQLDFSSAPLTGITGAIEFRLYGYGSLNSTGGVFGPDSFNSTLQVNGTSGGVHLEGSTVVVPEPSTYAVIFGLVAVGFVVFRRRRR